MLQLRRSVGNNKMFAHISEEYLGRKWAAGSLRNPLCPGEWNVRLQAGNCAGLEVSSESTRTQETANTSMKETKDIEGLMEECRQIEERLEALSAELAKLQEESEQDPIVRMYNEAFKHTDPTKNTVHLCLFT